MYIFNKLKLIKIITLLSKYYIINVNSFRLGN